MPRLKSAIKRVKTSERNNLRNSFVKAKIKTLIKKVKDAVKSESLDEATKLRNQTFSELDKATTKGTLHQNNAARKKAKVAQWLKTIEPKSK